MGSSGNRVGRGPRLDDLVPSVDHPPVDHPPGVPTLQAALLDDWQTVMQLVDMGGTGIRRQAY
ncbi:MAG: hypothetical protein R3A10_14965 [Caldilineaceae bacterium]